MYECLLSELLVFGEIFTADSLRYIMTASIVYLALCVALRRWSSGRRIGPRAPMARQMRREFALSMSSVVIFALSGYAIYHLVELGVFDVYTDVDEYGWLWWWASLVTLVFGHDAYFYAVHRLLHRPWWFRHIHRTHHRSVHPSPWAAYAFHPIEATLMAGYLPLVLLLLPVHGGVIFLFLLHMIVRNVLSHCGIALTARNSLGRWYTVLCTTTLHHDLHHSHMRGNYGFYFRHLDRWFGTERQDYASILESHLSADVAALHTAGPGAKS